MAICQTVDPPDVAVSEYHRAACLLVKGS